MADKMVGMKIRRSSDMEVKEAVENHDHVQSERTWD